jgi:D-alanyl-D-alanine carboxypeptidase
MNMKPNAAPLHKFNVQTWRCIFFAMAMLWLASAAHADKADDLVRAAMRADPIPGAALTVIKNGKRIKTAVYGMANLELQSPVVAETVFEIGSVTKQFTAAGIMLLVQDGKLSVDDKISRYLKDIPPSWTNITVRQLLTHTSGIPNYTVLDGFELRQHLTQAQFIQLLGSHPLDFAPGDSWSYCNSGFNLLGYVIENVSGKKYWDYMNERIFEPLGMSSTTNRAPDTLLRRRANGYDTNSEGKYINRDYDLTELFSAGAIVSTIGDMAKWNAALDTDKILTAESKKQMWTAVKLNNGTTHAYGFDWGVGELNGHRNIGHTGTTDGFSASFQRCPDDGLAVILLTNSVKLDATSKLAKEILAIYLKQ